MYGPLAQLRGLSHCCHALRQRHGRRLDRRCRGWRRRRRESANGVHAILRLAPSRALLGHPLL